MNFNNYYVIPIGDWRGDIHQICEEFMIETNKHKSQIMDAYFKSDERFNMTMNSHGDKQTQMLTDDYCLSAKARNLFTSKGVVDLPEVFDAEGAATLFMEFVKLSLPGFWYDYANGKDGEWLFGEDNEGLFVGMGAKFDV